MVWKQSQRQHRGDTAPEKRSSIRATPNPGCRASAPGFLLRMNAGRFGLLAELAYAPVSETGAARHEGSTPSKPTKFWTVTKLRVAAAIVPPPTCGGGQRADSMPPRNSVKLYKGCRRFTGIYRAASMAHPLFKIWMQF